MASSARFAQLRMRGQPEVVVRREVDDLAVIEGRFRLLLAFEDAQGAIEPCCFSASSSVVR